MTGYALLRGAVAAVLIFLAYGSAVPAETFPFDRDLVLDAAPMRPGKRMPILAVEPSGDARIDLWCRTVPARVEISDAAVRIEAGPLPEDMPTMQSAGQCTPERVQADEEFLATLTQVTGWRRVGDGIVLDGPKTLKFRASDH
jgi:hypothetical protein